MVIYIYYKLKYPFWSVQPVFHFHNIRYWMFPPGIIQHERPKINKFFDSNVKFADINTVTTEKKALFASLIKSQFMPHKHEKYVPKNKDIFNYFVSHNKPCFISLLYKPIIINNKLSKTLISSMTTRPLKLVIDKKRLNLYYVDFLCVHDNHRKKGIAPKTIYSHYYNHRIHNEESIFLFKRDGNTTAIVPLTAYNNYGFDLHHLSKTKQLTLPQTKCVLLTDASMRLYYELDRHIQSQVSCYISPNYSHLKHLIESDLLHIGIVIESNNLKAIYIFRNSHTIYESKASVECIASYNNGLNDNDFIKGFLDCLVMVMERFHYKIVFIENISHNNIIAKYMIKNFKLLFKCSSSYYFYNFGHHPISSNDVFIIN